MTLKRESKVQGSENGVLAKYFDMRKKIKLLRGEKSQIQPRERKIESWQWQEKKNEKKRKWSLKRKIRKQMSFYVKDSEVKRLFLY